MLGGSNWSSAAQLSICELCKPSSSSTLSPQGAACICPHLHESKGAFHAPLIGEQHPETLVGRVILSTTSSSSSAPQTLAAANNLHTHTPGVGYVVGQRIICLRVKIPLLAAVGGHSARDPAGVGCHLQCTSAAILRWSKMQECHKRGRDGKRAPTGHQGLQPAAVCKAACTHAIVSSSTCTARRLRLCTYAWGPCSYACHMHA